MQSHILVSCPATGWFSFKQTGYSQRGAHNLWGKIHLRKLLPLFQTPTSGVLVLCSSVVFSCYLSSAP